MIPMLANHLWQSTVFTAAAGLLTLVFRRNRAQARYAIWLTASIKFLIPFYLLVSAGTYLQWSRSPVTPPRLSRAMNEISEPFQPASQPRASRVPVEAARDLLPSVLLTVWLCGFAGLVLFWGARWRRLQLAQRGASPIDIGAPIRTLSSAACIEPGIFGLLRPALLLPEGITERLTPEQLAAIVAHELCHVSRRDNLAAAIHMIVEAVFWFHPLVWWIGARLVEERERACDEEVIRLGNDQQVYAEGILNVCKFYVESPLTCVSGVTGSNLKKRIEEIMTHQISRKLTFGRKLLLAAAGFAAVTTPIAIGIIDAPQVRAQPQAAPVPFEVASVKPNNSTDRGVMQALPGGTLTIRNGPLRYIIAGAYNVSPRASDRISGLPGWTESERFDIDAKAAPRAIPAGLSPKQRNDRSMLMLQSVLADRFKMTAHWETKQGPVYSLTIAKNGLKLPKAKIEEKDCPEVPTRTEYCHMFNGGQGQGLHGKTISITDLVDGLQGWTDHPVIDNTGGVKGLFDIDTEGWVPMFPRPGPPPGTEPSEEDKAFADPARPTLQQVLDKVGIKMESTKGPVQVLVIDHIERPAEN